MEADSVQPSYNSERFIRPPVVETLLSARKSAPLGERAPRKLSVFRVRSWVRVQEDFFSRSFQTSVYPSVPFGFSQTASNRKIGAKSLYVDSWIIGLDWIILAFHRLLLDRPLLNAEYRTLLWFVWPVMRASRKLIFHICVHIFLKVRSMQICLGIPSP
jgi:hypothetical protein